MARKSGRYVNRLAGIATGAIGLVLLFAPGSRLGNKQRVPTSRGAKHSQASTAYGKLPLSFEAIRGQADSQVDFIARGSGYRLFLTATEALWQFQNASGGESKAAPASIANRQSSSLRMKLVGAKAQARAEALDKLPGKANYFIGNDPSRWQTDVETYARVRYQDVYPGISLVYYGRKKQLEYDFVIDPGVDPKAIKLEFQGARELGIESQGDLVLRTEDGDVRWHKPLIYQELDGIRKQVQGSYVRMDERQVGFHLGDYDVTRTLVIDPMLSYSTYLGTDYDDKVTGLAADVSGNVYVIGQTLTPFTGDTFVAKLNPAGSELIYFTYIAGSNDDFAGDIAVDAAGNAYVTGLTYSTDFPSKNALQSEIASKISQQPDAFVTKLDQAGRLDYSTYLGGVVFDGGHGIAVDALGNAYVTGETGSINFPTVNPVQPPKLGHVFDEAGEPFSARDAFVAKVSPTGAALIYSTYLGGSKKDQGHSIAVDAAGNAYVTGTTYSTDFPTTPGAFQAGFALQPLSPDGVSRDAFVVKVIVDGSRLAYSTYLGGNGLDEGNSIAVDNSGNAYITGYTTSTTFPTVNALQKDLAGGPAFKTTNGGGQWMPSNHGLPDTGVQLSLSNTGVQALAIDRVNPSTVYAGTEWGGIYKSSDDGMTWSQMNNGLIIRDSITRQLRPSLCINSLVISPASAKTIYAGTDDGIFMSINGGSDWNPASEGLPSGGPARRIGILAIDPTNPSILYAGVGDGIFKSVDGGSQWNRVPNNNSLLRTDVRSLVIDPYKTSTLYVSTVAGIFKSLDGGESWRLSLTGNISVLAVDPANPMMLYAGVRSGGAINLFKSTNGGSSWNPSNNGLPPGNVVALVIDPANAMTLYAGVAGNGVYKSLNSGMSWIPAGRGLSSRINVLAIHPATPGTLYAGTVHSSFFLQVQFHDAFIVKLNATGSTAVYSTYLGGIDGDAGNDIAVNCAGEAYLTGVTYARDFITLDAVQPNIGGSFGGDAFVTKLNTLGNAVVFSTYLGGSVHDYGNSIALDSIRNIYVAGVSESGDFKTQAPLQMKKEKPDAFIAKIAGVEDTQPGGSNQPRCLEPRPRLGRGIPRTVR